MTVPVLSRTTVSTVLDVSSPWWPLKKIPSWAPRPEATRRAAGVASPRAQGQAMISTAKAALKADSTDPASTIQAMKVRMEPAITVGTKTPEIRSAKRCTEAFWTCACSTSSIMWASWVSPPTLVARTISRPVTTTVPPRTWWPSPTSIGTDSPVIELQSTADWPRTTCPSVAIVSPGRTMNRSPIRSSPIGRRRSESSSWRIATSFAPTAASARSALPARRRASASKKRPASRKVVTPAATSR